MNEVISVVNTRDALQLRTVKVLMPSQGAEDIDEQQSWAISSCLPWESFLENGCLFGKPSLEVVQCRKSP